LRLSAFDVFEEQRGEKETIYPQETLSPRKGRAPWGGDKELNEGSSFAKTNAGKPGRRRGKPCRLEQRKHRDKGRKLGDRGRKRKSQLIYSPKGIGGEKGGRVLGRRAAPEPPVFSIGAKRGMI